VSMLTLCAGRSDTIYVVHSVMQGWGMASRPSGHAVSSGQSGKKKVRRGVFNALDDMNLNAWYSVEVCTVESLCARICIVKLSTV
jgi:hypothetical protein